jgi:hypothetical protein
VRSSGFQRRVVLWKWAYTELHSVAIQEIIPPYSHGCENLKSNIKSENIFENVLLVSDRLCGLVVRVSGCRSRGPGFDSRRFQIFCEAVGLERGPLSLVRTTEELLGRNSSGSGLENRD